MTQNSDDPQPILIERGCFITHCGYAGEDKTEYSFRTPKTSIKAQFKHIFKDLLEVDPAQYSVVLVKDVNATQQVLREEAHILFTEFNVKACAFVNAQVGVVLSWVNKGTNGLIIDIGYESTIFVPIMENIAQMDYITVIPIAGRAIEQFIINLLIEHGVEKEIIQNHREQLFPYLMKDYFYFNAESEHDFEREAIEKRKSELPNSLTLKEKDGKSIDISLPSPILPPDLIIEIYDSRDLSFSKEINNHIMKILEMFGIDNLGSNVEYDYDPYTSWWVSRIIITGGASNILGLRSLLIRELLKETQLKRFTGCERAPSCPLVDVSFRDVAFTIRNVPLEDTPGTWLGASIESSLRAFKECYVSKEMYSNNTDIIFTLHHEKMWTSILK